MKLAQESLELATESILLVVMALRPRWREDEALESSAARVVAMLVQKGLHNLQVVVVLQTL